MKRLLALFLLWPIAAIAADLPTKAPTNPLFTGYPYNGSGFYWGLNTIGGGGHVNVADPTGANPNSLVTNQIAGGGTVGYVWSSGNIFYAVEGMFDIQNFNGETTGFSLSGPAAFEQRIKLGTPLSNVLALFPNFNLPTIPPFPQLPSGQTAQNIHSYLMAGFHEDDVSLNFQQTVGSAWQFAPSIGIGAMGQLSNDLAIDVWAETVFPAPNLCVGNPLGTACAGQGQKYLVGLGVYY